MSKYLGEIMKIGDLILWHNIPHIGVVQGIDGYMFWVYWLDDGHESWEKKSDLREVKKCP